MLITIITSININIRYWSYYRYLKLKLKASLMRSNVSKSLLFLLIKCNISSVQFSSVVQSCLTFCDPMDCSTPGFAVHHQSLEPIQTHVHHVGDAIQPSHPLSSPSPPTFNLSQHQGLFKWVTSSHQVFCTLFCTLCQIFLSRRCGFGLDTGGKWPVVP